MKLIYCADPTSEKDPDARYHDEIELTEQHGLAWHTLNYKALVEQQNVARAIQDIPVQAHKTPAIYRGWSLTSKQYRLLYDALLSRGLQLINTPDAYKQVHHLPDSLPIIEPYTPHTIWTELDTRFKRSYSLDAIMSLLLRFAGKPIVVRDFARMQKHYWWQAAYISSASDPIAVKNTLDYLLQLKHHRIEGGFVFREFIEFEHLLENQRAGLPLIREYRIVFLAGIPIMTLRYWDVDGIEDEQPPLDDFMFLADQVNSQFFTVDVAKRTDGKWMILDLDDGQITPLPNNADANRLFEAFANLHIE